MDFSGFQSAMEYVGFTPASSAALREFHPVVQQHFEHIIDDFYATIEAHPRASKVIIGGKPQVARLKKTLVRWLDSVLLGPHDAAFVESHSRIGHVHVRIDLPQDLMFTAMNRIRQRVVEVADTELADDPGRRRAVTGALDKILDLELAIMLDSYRDNLEGRMRASERLATIGQLAASIGHELRNPLGIIESSLFLVRHRLERAGVDDAGVDKHLDKIGLQVKICGKTITDLLELARSRPPRRQSIDVALLVEYAAESAAMGDGVRVEREIPDGIRLDADPDQMRQVLSNLLGNASQAMGGQGRIWISAERREGGVALRVRDEGPGVPPEHRDQIFDALYTTKPKGTGLGLALCRRILEAHKGELSLEAHTGGAVFRVWIPDFAVGAVEPAQTPG
jgi:signal transduction histidine kinase